MELNSGLKGSMKKGGGSQENLSIWYMSGGTEVDKQRCVRQAWRNRLMTLVLHY